MCSNFFDGDAMSGDPNDVYDEDNEEFVWRLYWEEGCLM